MIPRPIFSERDIKSRMDNIPGKKSPTREALSRFRQERVGYEPGAPISAISLKEPGFQFRKKKSVRKSKKVKKSTKVKKSKKVKKSRKVKK